MIADWAGRFWTAVRRHPIVSAIVACVVALSCIAAAAGKPDVPATTPVGIHGSAIKPAAPVTAPAYSVGKMTPSGPASSSAPVPTPTITPTVVPHATVAPSTKAPPPPPVKPTKLGPWRNCTEAKANGRCDIQRGDPDYAPKLDRDKDGVACEC